MWGMPMGWLVWCCTGHSPVKGQTRILMDDEPGRQFVIVLYCEWALVLSTVPNFVFDVTKFSLHLKTNFSFIIMANRIQCAQISATSLQTTLYKGLMQAAAGIKGRDQR